MEEMHYEVSTQLDKKQEQEGRFKTLLGKSDTHSPSQISDFSSHYRIYRLGRSDGSRFKRYLDLHTPRGFWKHVLLYYSGL